jgi:hypothetical protein
MTPISFIDANDQLVEADLDGTTYHLSLSWNEEGQAWAMGMRNLDLELLVSGVAVLPSTLLLSRVRRPSLPPGDIIVAAGPGVVLRRDSFASGAAAMFYLSPSDRA